METAHVVAGVDGGTGSPGCESSVIHGLATLSAPSTASADALMPAGELLPEAAVAGEVAPGTAASASDSVAPLHPSVAVAAAEEVAEDTDLREYAWTLGVDATHDEDLLWVVEEAFNAPLPGSWAEYADDTGRVYYFHDASSKTTWEHPMDEVFRELIAFIKQTRAELAGAPEVHRLGKVREHLEQAHARALRELQVWSGPYASDQGEYYYNEELKASTWECPVTEWQNELTVRHDVLTRCLLDETSSTEAFPESVTLSAALRLPLGLVRRECVPGEVPETPSTSRTFYTARSAASSRSKHSDRSKRAHKKDRDSEHRKHRSSRDQKAASSASMEPPMPPNVFQAVD